MQGTLQQPVQVTPIDEPGRKILFRGLLWLVALEPLVIFIVLLVLGVPWWVILLLIAGVAVLVGFVFWLIAMTLWRPWQRRFPSREMLDGAVSKSWQSFGFNRFARLNNCVTIVADQRHLHLLPFAPMRLFGAGVISLPLNSITDVSRGLLPGQMSAMLDGRRIYGPEWCLSLAAG